VNDYTIQMDIYLEKLPPKRLSLYSTTYPDNKSDGAVFVNEKGSVGTLDEFGLSPSLSLYAKVSACAYV